MNYKYTDEGYAYLYILEDDGSPMIICECGLDDTEHVVGFRTIEYAERVGKPVAYRAGNRPPHIFTPKKRAVP